jgi:hypothetical protein
MRTSSQSNSHFQVAGIDSHSIAWHSLSDGATQKKLQTDMNGLSQSQVEERLQEFGKNTLPAPKPPTLLLVVLHQFASPLIYILLIAGVVSLVIGDVKDAVFIFAVILLNAVIGTMQEWRAEKQAHALQVLLKIQAKVRRTGHRQSLPAEELVPGDVVLIESGDKVPADLRLIQTNNLAIDESFLTGESLPAEKNTTVLNKEIPVSDRKNMAYAGATVITGRGMGLDNRERQDAAAHPDGTLFQTDQRDCARVCRLVGSVVGFTGLVFQRGILPHGRHDGIGDPGRLTGRHDGCPSDCDIPHGETKSDCAQTDGGGEPGELHNDRQRQDRHAHGEPTNRQKDFIP